MSLKEFRQKVQHYRRPSGFTQQALAGKLGLSPTVLSHKLNGTDNTYLTHTEVKAIVKTLAAWEAITTREQAIELLELMNLKFGSFSPIEWEASPLNQLEVAVKTKEVAASSFKVAVSPRINITTEAEPPAEPQPLAGLFQPETEPTRYYLPAQSTPFIDRESEVAAAQRLLQRADVRLLTFSGPGGIGKTRLALQIAANLLHDFKDGVFFVPLAAVTEPLLVASQLAHVLEITETVHTGSKAALFNDVKKWLSNKQLLLVLDNFEQLLAAAGLVGELLEAAPGLKILVTSRARLRVYGEYEYEVPALSLPPKITATAPPDLQTLLRYEAIELFVQRARAARYDFALSLENASAVAEICTRLDGLPLAIELAAARCRLFSPQVLLSRLTSRLSVLTDGPLNLPKRQQTLRNTIDWSFDLLDEAEKQFFTSLAVFVNGCFPASTAAITTSSINLEFNETDPVLLDVMEKLDALQSKSMLKQVPGNSTEPRFIMLETIREYALEQLAANPDKEVQLRRWHVQYFLGLAEQAAPALSGAQQTEWFERLEQEYPNLRAALEWCRHLEDGPELALRLSLALRRFWLVRGYVSEGRQHVAAVLELAAPLQTTPHYVQLLEAASVLAQEQSDWSATQTLLNECVSLCQQTNNAAGLAAALTSLGSLFLRQGITSTAKEFYRQSLTLLHQLNDQAGMARCLNNLGITAKREDDLDGAFDYYEQSANFYRAIGDKRGLALNYLNRSGLAGTKGDMDAAEEYARKGLVIYRELKEKGGIGACLSNLGEVAQTRGDWPTAKEYHEESLSIKQELGDSESQAYTLCRLGEVAQMQGNYVLAARRFVQGLTSYRQLTMTGAAARPLLSLAELAIVEGQPEAALQRYWLAIEWLEAVEPDAVTRYRAKWESALADIRTRLGEEVFNAIVEQRSAMSLEQITDEIAKNS